MVDKYPIKVNIGCSMVVALGWINFDASLKIQLLKHNMIKCLLYRLKLVPKEAFETKFPSNVIRLNVTRGLPFKTDSIDYIYCSHMLEHLSKKDATKVLKECYRVLKPTGWIRIVVPDLKLIATKYVEGDYSFFKVNRREELANAFLRTLSLIDERPLMKRILSYPLHRWAYDFDSFMSLLLLSGFKRVGKKTL